MDNNEAYKKAKARVRSLKGFYRHFTVYIVVNLFLIIADNVHMHEWDFHFVGYANWTVPIFWGIGLFFHFLSVFVFRGLFGSEWEERKIKELMNKNKE